MPVSNSKSLFLLALFNWRWAYEVNKWKSELFRILFDLVLTRLVGKRIAQEVVASCLWVAFDVQMRKRD